MRGALLDGALPLFLALGTMIFQLKWTPWFLGEPLVIKLVWAKILPGADA